MSNRCVDCGKGIDPRAKRCHPCAGKVVRARSNTPEWRRKHSEAMKAAHACGIYDDIYNPEIQRKKSESMKAARARGVCDSPETRRKMSKSKKAAWARGDHDGHPTAMKAAWERGAYDNRAIAGPPYKSTEIPLAAALDVCGIEHQAQFRPEGCRFVFDEFIFPGLLLEVHGDYWHGPKRPENQKRDVKKATWAEENGFTLVVIWEHEIEEQGARSLVHERILPLLGVM